MVFSIWQNGSLESKGRSEVELGKANWLVVYLPLWKMMELVSWDDDIQTYGDTFTIHMPKYPKSTWHGIPQRNSWANPRFLDSQHVLRLFTYMFTLHIYIIIYTLSFHEKRNKVPNQRTRWPVDPPKISIARALPQTDVSSSDLLAAVKAWFHWPQGFNDRNPTCVQNASFHPTGEFDANHGYFSYPLVNKHS